MDGLILSEAQKSLLRSQVIGPDSPGTILHDFQAVLDRIGVEGVELAGKYNLLPMSLLGELDQLMSRPLHLSLKMKRPQLRSHPYLQAINLLLRATGLIRVKGSGTKARLVADQDTLASWSGLNFTERYFTLLEAWLWHGEPEMIGERGGGMRSTLSNVLQNWRCFPTEAEKARKRWPERSILAILGCELYHVALLDLFGIMEIEHPGKPPQPWSPAAARRRPFGDALFTLLTTEFLESFDWVREDEASRRGRFGDWQPIFQAYFPAWKNNLTPPAPEEREGTFVFRISLGDIWRRIAIPADHTLYSLLCCILKSVGFDNDHLHQFTYRDRFGGTVRASHPDCDDELSSDDVAIGELPLSVGQSMELLFDFGDDCKFNVKLEEIHPGGARLKAPKVIDKHGKAPEQYPNSDW